MLDDLSEKEKSIFHFIGVSDVNLQKCWKMFVYFINFNFKKLSSFKNWIMSILNMWTF